MDLNITNHEKDLRKIRQFKQEIKSFELHNSKWYKKSKKKFLRHFDPVARVSDLNDGLQGTTL